jgi:hypothetical protein
MKENVVDRIVDRATNNMLLIFAAQMAAFVSVIYLILQIAK